MSTRSIIARTDGDGFTGRYHHGDGYPRGVGKTLYTWANGYYKDNLEGMMRFLCDEHRVGWSTINGYSPAKKPGYREYTGAKRRRLEARFTDAHGNYDYAAMRTYEQEHYGPMCYCHGDRHETEEYLITDRDRQTDTEWSYAINERTKKMHIYKSYYANHETFWVWVCAVDLDGGEPNWQTIEDAGYARAENAEAQHAERMAALPGPFSRPEDDDYASA